MKGNPITIPRTPISIVKYPMSLSSESNKNITLAVNDKIPTAVAIAE